MKSFKNKENAWASDIALIQPLDDWEKKEENNIARIMQETERKIFMFKSIKVKF